MTKVYQLSDEEIMLTDAPPGCKEFRPNNQSDSEKYGNDIYSTFCNCVTANAVGLAVALSTNWVTHHILIPVVRHGPSTITLFYTSGNILKGTLPNTSILLQFENAPSSLKEIYSFIEAELILATHNCTCTLLSPATLQAVGPNEQKEKLRGVDKFQPNNKLTYFAVNGNIFGATYIIDSETHSNRCGEEEDVKFYHFEFTDGTFTLFISANKPLHIHNVIPDSEKDTLLTCAKSLKCNLENKCGWFWFPKA
ncbi:hypothetical protein C8Q75DRAFT_736336 [Abortiporus biennis]|nr:hypothetical protein C8Q75DRAFT_736336 [Abortiporus biennis]